MGGRGPPSEDLEGTPTAHQGQERDRLRSPEEDRLQTRRRGGGEDPQRSEAQPQDAARGEGARGLALAGELSRVRHEGGKPLDPATATQRYFHPVLERAGVKRVGFHALRHTFATLHLLNGEHVKVVQEALGHSTIAETMNRYSHVLPSMQAEAAKRLDALF